MQRVCMCSVLMYTQFCTVHSKENKIQYNASKKKEIYKYKRNLYKYNKFKFIL